VASNQAPSTGAFEGENLPTEPGVGADVINQAVIVARVDPRGPRLRRTPSRARRQRSRRLSAGALEGEDLPADGLREIHESELGPTEQIVFSAFIDDPEEFVLGGA